MNDVIKRERERLARDLHDRLGQSLAGLKLDVAWLQRRLAQGTGATPAVVQRLSEMMTHIDASVDEVRAIAYTLRMPVLRPDELREALETHVRAMAARGGLNVFCDIEHDLPLSSEECMQIFRIVQEAITNTIRHAGASSIWVSLCALQTNIELRIRDDGQGLPTKAEGAREDAFGIQSMAERAHLINARFAILPAPQGGTLVHLILPLDSSRRTSTDSSSTQGKLR